LPSQKSGFSNLASEWAIKEVCKEMGIEWKKEKNFIIDRLPILINYYLFAPSTLPYGD
jgi:hypothetical protein